MSECLSASATLLFHKALGSLYVYLRQTFPEGCLRPSLLWRWVLRSETTRHKMILAASLLALVAMATAVPAAPDENWCCLPDKYEMSEVDIKQFGSGYMEVNRLYFDGTAKKSATIGSLLVPGQPSVFKFRNVIDYNLHKMFTIQPDNSCHSDDFIDAFAKPCVSKDWPVLASSYVGDQSVGEKFEVFHFNTGSANLTTVMDHNCVPIVQYIKGKYGRYDIDSSQFFSDYKAGNSDPAVFDVPAGC